MPCRLRLCLGSVALLALVFAGCASSRRVMLGPARPAIVSAEAVRVYEKRPRRAQEIALIEGSSVGELRHEAAALGANGIVIGGVVNRPGPVLGIGIGGSSWSFGRRSAVGIGGGASFAVPTGGQTLEAIAIYVP